MQVDLARGYSHPQLHNISAKVSLDALEALAEHEPLPLANCTRTARRFKGNQFVLNETKVAAIRISANGWEASILHGLQVCRTSQTDSFVLYLKMWGVKPVVTHQTSWLESTLDSIIAVETVIHIRTETLLS